MVGKIKAAIEAREDPNLLIIARCDARAIEGPEGLYQRLRAYAKAGADLLYPEAPCSAKDIREDAEHLKGFPLYLIGSWLSPRYGLTFQDIADMGYSVMILSTLAFAIASKAVYDVAMEVRRLGTYPDFVKEGKEFSWDDLQELIRLPEVRRIEERFLPSGEKKRRWHSEKLPKEYYQRYSLGSEHRLVFCSRDSPPEFQSGGFRTQLVLGRFRPSCATLFVMLLRRQKVDAITRTW